MKINKIYKRLDLSKRFIVIGSKKNLLLFEEVLKYNMVESREPWNSSMKEYDSTIFILYDKKENRYVYHNCDCGLSPINVKKFL